MNRVGMPKVHRQRLLIAIASLATSAILILNHPHIARANGTTCGSPAKDLTDLQASIAAFVDPANPCTTIDIASDIDIDADLPVIAIGEIDALEAVQKPLTIEGNGNVLTGSGRPSGFLIHLGFSAGPYFLAVRNLGMTGFGGAGAISVTNSNFSIERSRFTNNFFVESSPISSLADASAGAVNSLGPLSVTDSVFDGNQGSLGGAIHSGSSEQLDIFGSTFADNTASVGGAVYSKNSLTMANSTVSGNVADSVGGLNIIGTAALIFSTIVNNTSSFDGAAVTAFGTIYSTASIIYGNLGPPSADPVVYTDLLSTEGELSVEYSLLTSSITSRSLVSPFDIGNTNLIGIDPELLPLGNHGGFSLPGGGRIPTHAPRRISPAIDAVGSLILTARVLDTDQRGAGYPRFVDEVADMGAVEYQRSGPRFDITLPETPSVLPNTR